MKLVNRLRALISCFCVIGALAVNSPAQNSQPQYPTYPSETPQTFQVNQSSWDYARRTAEIPMRDGVKLHTVILVPKGAKSAPILMTRPPDEPNGRWLDGRRLVPQWSISCAKPALHLRAGSHSQE